MTEALRGIIARLDPERRAVLADLLRSEPELMAIVGIGCRFPGGVYTPAAFWEFLQDGRDGCTDVPADRWDMAAFYDPDPNVPDKSYVRQGGFLADLSLFDADFFGISPHEALRLDPQQRLLLETTWHALEDAGLAGESLAGSATGVFIGMTNNQHVLRQVMADPEYYRDPFAGIGSDCSAAAGRLAYTFDLRGPTISLDTACSSSLVALHLACQSLRNKECNLAVVGGVYAIMVPQTLIIGCRMGMFAADGRCKTFDMRADGYGLGEGCGIVVVKRLQDALDDGDDVRAIIRGSAVNEDGRSNGLTAPNGLAQQAVIRQALANAGIVPHLVGYVEAHGTGTPLGDPIEVESVQAVLNKDRPPHQPLFIGSVKTNLGHLYTAAGIAGLIKTVLALQHRAIPPHLHFEQPNPTIAWEDRLQIPTRLTPWTPIEGRRVAGVSSFGWSGTNAHVIVEEAPGRELGRIERPFYLLPLSARTATALDSVTTRLYEYLRDQPETNLADVAYTLQSGRPVFTHRRILICRDQEDALRILSGDEPARRFDYVQPAVTRPIAFMFAGVGDHYQNMARELYELEPLFRDVVDHCCDVLQPLLDADLRQVLYPVNSSHASLAEGFHLRRMLGRNNGVHPAMSKPLAQTEFAQPAVFVVEYALTQLLQAWGITPGALLGHSLGEYVAACVAGVFSLEDALKLVARRAQMIQALPPGQMLAVSLSPEAIQPFLNENISLALHNSTATCTLAGPPTAIARLEAELKQREIAFRLLETTRAFHSSMMASIADQLTALVQTIPLHPPVIPYLSNVTGTWITDAQATDPGYWAQHLCQPVRFFAGLSQILQQEDQVLLEIGPGQSLGSFARQHPDCIRSRMRQILATLPAAHENRSALATALEAVGKLWLLDVRPTWSAFDARETRRRVPLPTYPFERQRFWVGPKMRRFADEPILVDAPAVKVAEAPPRRPISDWFYLPSWQQVAPHNPTLPGMETAGTCWLLFTDEAGLGQQIAAWLAQREQLVVTVQPGQSWQSLGAEKYALRPQYRADYDALFQVLQQQGQRPTRIVHLWGVSVDPPLADDAKSLEQALAQGFYSLLYLVQALQTQGLDACELSVVTSHVQAVTGSEPLSPGKATVIGPCRAIPLEYEHVQCRLIDVTLSPAGSLPAEALLTHLLGELTADFTEPMVALRGHQRWRQTFTPLRPSSTLQGNRPRLRHKGTYLITGGLGGLGLAVAEYLAKTAQANVVLIGRSPLPPRHEWRHILASEESTSALGRKISQVQQLEAMGAEVLPLAADVTDERQMRMAVQQALVRFGAIHGVIHAAGVPGKGVIQLKTLEMTEQVLAPKIRGTLLLERVLEGVILDFMLLFSSISSFTAGGPGQADYCAANAFLDAYAQSCAGQSRLTMAINWGEWQWNAWEDGLSDFSPKVQNFFRENRAQFGIQFVEGNEVLSRILACNLPQIIVATQDFSRLMQSSRLLTISALLGQGNLGQKPGRRHSRPTLGATYVAPRDDLERTVAAVWEEALGIMEIGIDDNFFELGGNSLIGLNLVRRLQQALDLPKMPDRILYEASSVRALVEVLSQNQNSHDLIDAQHARGQKRHQRYARQKRERMGHG